MNFAMNNTKDNTSSVGIASFDAAGDHAPASAVNRGDVQAFEIFVRRYEPKLMAIALVFTRVQGHAENIVQETLRKAFLHLRQFEGESSFFTWLTRIAVKEAFMSLRKRGAR